MTRTLDPRLRLAQFGYVSQILAKHGYDPSVNHELISDDRGHHLSVHLPDLKGGLNDGPTT